MSKKTTAYRCDDCQYFSYDEEYEDYLCTLYLDEDEMVRFMSNSYSTCPYYKQGDEYKIVRKQM